MLPWLIKCSQKKKKYVRSMCRDSVYKKMLSFLECATLFCFHLQYKTSFPYLCISVLTYTQTIPFLHCKDQAGQKLGEIVGIYRGISRRGAVVQQPRGRENRSLSSFTMCDHLRGKVLGKANPPIHVRKYHPIIKCNFPFL